MAKENTNVYTYLIYIFLFLIFINGIIFLGNEVITNPNANVDNESIDYIAELQGINLTEYEVTKQQLEQSNLISDNSTQGNPKDYALAFQYAKEEGLSIENNIKTIFNIPGTLLFKVLKLPVNHWSWLLSILYWLFNLSILIATVYFVTNR